MKTILITIIITLFSFVSAETTLVIFGATGDLSAKKLFPAVYNIADDNLNVVGVGRKPFSQEEFHQLVFEALQKNSRQKPSDLTFIQKHISYFPMSFEDESAYERLKTYLGDKKDVIYYLATEPQYFTKIIHSLKQAGLIESQKVIIEKPFGYDLDSARKLYTDISQYLKNEQMYLIDHYLGKEGVLHLTPLRFGNPELNVMWNAEHIDNIQINLAEKIGIGTRGNFWEGTGLLRDVVQNHIIQMLAYLAMDKEFADCGSVHVEKVKALNAIGELKLEDVVRGQYDAGIVDGEAVKGYLQENDVANDSQVETFIAARLFIHNERWAGVPFYIRAGKRLSKQATEIVVTFKEKGKLYIRIQPESMVSFEGAEVSQPEQSHREAYECLIQAAIDGDQTYFVDIEEIFTSWRLFTPILNAWQQSPVALDRYEAGSFGPASADKLLEQDGRYWHKF